MSRARSWPWPAASTTGCRTSKLVDKNGDGIYTGTNVLEPGVYEYKFVINGEWKIDERNPNFVPNDIGSLNSVLELESK